MTEPEGQKFTHKPCGGLVWAEEWVTSILGRCNKCGQVWHILDPMNDVFGEDGKCREWLFGPEWSAGKMCDKCGGDGKLPRIPSWQTTPYKCDACKGTGAVKS